MATSSYVFPLSSHLLFLLLLLSFLPPSIHSISFQIDRFKTNESDALYQGDALPSVGSVEFNDVNYLCRVGWIIYKDIVPIWDSKTGKTTDFTTHFTFLIDTQNVQNYGHGIAFFLAPIGFQILQTQLVAFLAFSTPQIVIQPSTKLSMLNLILSPIKNGILHMNMWA